MVRICVCGILSATHRTSIVRSVRPIHPSKIALTIGLEHVGSRLGQPAVDKVAMHTVAGATRQLERRLARPSAGKDIAKVVANRKPELWLSLHTLRAAILRLEIVLPVLRA